MIIFEKIKYKNFLSTGNVFTEITLNKSHITAIIGKNGSGKSSGIIDAVFYALYGKSFRRLKNDQMVNSINQKNMLVELSFKIDNKKYMVHRGTKPNIFDVYVDGILKEQMASKKDYQVWLEDVVLKMNATTMKQLVFLGSTSYIPFMRLTPNDRRKVVEEILDIQVFSTMNTLVRGKANNMSTEYNEIKHKLKLLANSLTLKTNHLSEVKQQKETLIAENEQKIQELLDKISETNNKITKSMSFASKKLTEITDNHKITKNITELSGIVGNISKTKEIARKNKLFFEKNKNCPSCSQDIDEEFREKMIKENEKKINKLAKAISQANNQISSFNTRIKEIEEIEKEIKKYEHEVSTGRVKVSGFKERIDSLQDNINKSNNREKSSENETSLKDDIVSIEAESKVLRNTRDEISDTSQYYSVVSTLLKDSGIKSRIIENYLPTINSLIRKYLEVLEFPCEFVFDSEFNETIKSRFRDKFSYSNFSEGQKCRIDLALLFTWRELAKLRNAASCNLLVLDEIGSSSLDSEGVTAFLKIIDSQEESNNIFVITHNSEMVFSDEIPVIEFEIKNNFSKILTNS